MVQIALSRGSSVSQNPRRKVKQHLILKDKEKDTEDEPAQKADQQALENNHQSISHKQPRELSTLIDLHHRSLPPLPSALSVRKIAFKKWTSEK